MMVMQQFDFQDDVFGNVSDVTMNVMAMLIWFLVNLFLLIWILVLLLKASLTRSL